MSSGRDALGEVLVMAKYGDELWDTFFSYDVRGEVLVMPNAVGGVLVTTKRIRVSFSYGRA